MTKKFEKEVLKVYDIWLDSYLNGDVETYDKFLDKDYHFIGSTNNEEFLSKKDTTQFFADTAGQMAGKTQLRNETKIIEKFEELVFITHLFDAWFLNGTDWAYYGRFRFTNALKKNKEGWRFIYQHYSVPDAKAEEGETIGIEQISAENLQLREAIKRRTVELEQKNRELEIEAALDCIRAQAVAMQQSSDLLDIVVTMRTEFIKLGHEAHYFWHMTWLPEKYEKAMTSGDGSRIGFVMELPRHIHGDIPLLANWEKSEDSIVIYPMGAEAAIDYVDKMIALGDFQNIDPQAPSHEDIRHIGGLTFIMARTSHGEIGYSLPGVVENPPKEDLEILERFAGAFDLAHRRFLDLKRAEHQTRETQIELALEKVRSRTIGMQRSDELRDTAMLLFQQVEELGIPSFACGFNIWDEDKRAATAWMASKNRLQPPFKTDSSEDVYLLFYEAEKRGESLFVLEQGGKELEAHYNYLVSIPEVNALAKAGLSFPTFQIIHCAYFTHGYLMFITYESVHDAHDIFKRFAKVFEQTYTRFLDLQKAEAQAKEAQIEVALEKVRSRSLAMHKSDELRDVIATVFQQLQILEFEAPACGLIIYNEDLSAEHWFAGFTLESYPKSYAIPYIDTPYFTDLLKEWQKGTEYMEFIMEGQAKVDYGNWLLEFSEFKTLPKEFVEQSGMITPKPLYFADAYMRYGMLEVIGNELLQEDKIAILKRFSKVFEQSYTRFLDLQNAEAQTREAQINLAVERVRAKALAMHQSEDIMEVVTKLKDEVMSLDIPDVIAATIFLNEGEDKVRMWDLSSLEEDSNGYQVPFDITFKLKKHDPNLYIKRVWENQENYFVDIQDKKGFKRIIAWLREHDELKFANEVEDFIKTTQLKQLYHAAKKLNNGKLVIDLLNPPSAEMETILTKMGAAFDLAYKRFEDLQKAEAQTREARIEAALERVRSRSMAMHKSEELLEVIEVVAEQLIQLNLKFDTVSFGKNNQQGDFTFWFSSKGQLKPLLIQVPFLNIRVLNSVRKAQKKEINFISDVFTAEENTKWSQHMIDFSELKSFSESVKDFILNAPGFARSSFLLKNINLYVGNYRAIAFTNDENAIFSRFAQVFEQSYTRFLDLQKAEAQAREAQIEVALERVRARALAMQNPEELKEVADVLRTEMGLLGVEELETCSIYINDKTSEITECWYALKDIRSKNKKLVNDHFELDLNNTWVGRKMLQFYKLKKEQVSIVMTGKNRKEWIDYCEKHSMPLQGYYGKVIPDRTYHLYKFSHGAIGVATAADISDENWNLLKRTASVFSLAYSRFKDLTQARFDLQLLKEEKKRAEEALSELQTTQTQLIQSEKMASLGELTAGIAHEIQNPLNFVNNFSEVSKELLEEMLEEIENGDMEEVKAIMSDVVQNLEKINHHGNRADGIVKGMLQHSRAGGDKKEPTDINALADEYLRLAYHGLRAKDKSFNSELVTDFDDTIKTIEAIPQDIGRVILNLLTNAFYVVNEKKKLGIKDYEPTVAISTKKKQNSIIITVTDNGNGMPESVKEKIFQPFFTTKPTGQGTGLGLSMSYDIVTKGHGGELKVETKEAEGTTFIIKLPTSKSTTK